VQDVVGAGQDPQPGHAEGRQGRLRRVGAGHGQTDEPPEEQRQHQPQPDDARLRGLLEEAVVGPLGVDIAPGLGAVNLEPIRPHAGHRVPPRQHEGIPPQPDPALLQDVAGQPADPRRRPRGGHHRGGRQGPDEEEDGPPHGRARSPLKGQGQGGREEDEHERGGRGIRGQEHRREHQP
jgi:hypothetical protein